MDTLEKAARRVESSPYGHQGRPGLFRRQRIHLADTPIFTPAACEGTTTLFEVDYFDDQKAYLTQSGQLYNEATAAAFGKSYAFGPTFRAEKSKTRRHLTEFWMVEPEVAYAGYEDMMDLGEGLILSIVERVLTDRQEELKTLERDTTVLEAISAPFPRIHYDDAVKLLQEGHAKGELENNFEWGGDFGAPDETYLSNQHGKPVFVHHFPAAIKGFYFEVDKDRPECALGIDLLAPEGYGEIIGGGERAAILDYLIEQLKSTQPAAGNLRMVPRPPPLRLRPPRRLRHGHRTHRRLDVRHRTCSGDNSVSEDVV